METHNYHIHLGAHRTATTHLQDTLALHQAELRTMGVEAPTRSTLRARGLGKRTLRKGLGRLLPDGLACLRLRRIIDALAVDGRRSVLSEEKLLGFVRDLLVEPIYPELEQRVALLHRALGSREATLCLSVRDPGTLLPSAYVQCLRMGNRGLPDFDTVRARTLGQPLRWSQLLRRIQAAAPGRPVRIWTFESYVADPGHVLDALTGTRGVSWRRIEAPASTRGISLQTIARIRALPAGMDRAAYRAACLRIGDEDRGGERFSPFTPTESALITQAYQDDLDALCREQACILATTPSQVIKGGR